MANRERGEVDLAARGQTYTFVLTTNGAAELETATGRLFEDICQGVQKYSVRDMRWLIWAALQEHHAAEIKTPSDAGRLIDDAGGLAAVWLKLHEFLKANADDSPDASGGASADPPGAQDRSGDVSTLTPAVSA